MNPMNKNIALFFIIPLLFVACIKQRRGFTLAKITPKHSYRLKCEGNPDRQRFLQIFHSFLQSEATYLGSGNHCYVFASNDGKYVIKFFKQNPMKAFSWRDLLPVPVNLQLHNLSQKEKRKRLREKTYNSYKHAIELLPNETGVVFAHLDASKILNRPLILRDKHGKKHRINANRLDFIVQKRARIGFDPLDELLRKAQAQKAFNAIASLFEVVISRCKLGLFDKDMQIYKNFGFIHDQAIETDVGEFYCASNEMRPNAFQELHHVAWQIENWLKIHHPQYLSNFYQVYNAARKTIEP